MPYGYTTFHDLQRRMVTTSGYVWVSMMSKHTNGIYPRRSNTWLAARLAATVVLRHKQCLRILTSSSGLQCAFDLARTIEIDNVGWFSSRSIKFLLLSLCNFVICVYQAQITGIFFAPANHVASSSQRSCNVGQCILTSARVSLVVCIIQLW
jgi:hypothetical protein